MADTARSDTPLQTYKNFIVGEWVESVSGRTYPVYNPANKTEALGEFQTSNADDAATAVAAAREELSRLG